VIPPDDRAERLCRRSYETLPEPAQLATGWAATGRLNETVVYTK
jgi:hypothetical protein